MKCPPPRGSSGFAYGYAGACGVGVWALEAR